MSFGAIATDLGNAKRAAAAANATPFTLDEFVCGYSNVAPAKSDTAIAGEVYRGPINSAAQDSVQANEAVFEAILPLEAGPFIYNRIFWLDADGDVVAISAYNDTEKTLSSDNLPDTKIERVRVEFTTADAVSFEVTNNTVYVSKDLFDTTVEDLYLPAINVSGGDTAIDVAIDDTRSHDDCGAWRSRGDQAWAREGLDGDARGSKASYPARASYELYADRLDILDADKTGLPLWKSIPLTGVTPICVEVENGFVAIGTTTGLIVLDFVMDDLDAAIRYDTASSPALPHNQVNAIAMDLDYYAERNRLGLRRPTLYLATNAGACIVFWDERIITSLSSVAASHIFAYEDRLFWSQAGVSDFPTRYSDALIRDLEDGFGAITFTDLAGGDPSLPIGDTPLQAKAGRTLAGGATSGLVLLSPTYKAVAAIASDYNSLWMVGDILGCFLASSADEGSLVGGERMVNGGFDTDLSGYSTTTNATHSGGTAVLGENATLRQTNVVPASGGAKFIVSWDQTITAGTRTRVLPYDFAGNTISDFTGGGTGSGFHTGDGTKSFFLEGNTNGYTFRITTEAGNAAVIDNISVLEIVSLPDRSVHNQPIDVQGSVTLSAMGPNADLRWHSFAADESVDLGTDITASGSLVWFERIGGAARHHILNFDGSDSYVDGEVGTPPTAGVEIVGSTLTFKAGSVLAVVRPSETPISAALAALIYADEAPILAGPSTFGGSSSSVSAIGYDAVEGRLHVGTPDGRSVFSGLTRIDHANRPVTAAIATRAGFVVEE